jgi:hypothetical protein
MSMLFSRHKAGANFCWTGTCWAPLVRTDEARTRANCVYDSGLPLEPAMTKTLTTERLKELADPNMICKCSWDEYKSMARELLANREAQPVALIDRRPAASRVAWRNDGDKLPHGTELFTAPPAPAVPDFKALAENLVDNLVDCGGADEKAVEQYLAFAEKTCRAAMLAQPVSQGKLPDCVLVLLNHIEDVLDDESWSRISVEKWNAVTMLAAAPEGGNG